MKRVIHNLSPCSPRLPNSFETVTTDESHTLPLTASFLPASFTRSAAPFCQDHQQLPTPAHTTHPPRRGVWKNSSGTQRLLGHWLYTLHPPRQGTSELRPFVRLGLTSTRANTEGHLAFTGNKWPAAQLHPGAARDFTAPEHQATAFGT